MWWPGRYSGPRLARSSIALQQIPRRICFCDRRAAALAGAAFFSLLQQNVLDRRRWDTREELRIAIVTWIERTYAIVADARPLSAG